MTTTLTARGSRLGVPADRYAQTETTGENAGRGLLQVLEEERRLMRPKLIVDRGWLHVEQEAVDVREGSKPAMGILVGLLATAIGALIVWLGWLAAKQF